MSILNQHLEDATGDYKVLRMAADTVIDIFKENNDLNPNYFHAVICFPTVPNASGRFLKDSFLFIRPLCCTSVGSCLLMTEARGTS